MTGQTTKGFDVVCSICGQETRVPFRPRGDRPVRCAACWQNFLDVQSQFPRQVSDAIAADKTGRATLTKTRDIALKNAQDHRERANKKAEADRQAARDKSAQ